MYYTTQDNEEEQSAITAKDEGAPEVVKVELDLVAEDAFFLSIVHDPTEPMRHLGILNDDNTVNDQIWKMMGAEAKAEIERIGH